MQNINFNNKAMTKNKKEICRTMQKISRTQTKKQPLNKERKDKKKYLEKLDKAYPIYSKQIGIVCNKNLKQEENKYFEKVKVISNSKDSFSSSKQLQPALALKKLSDNFLLSQTKTLVQKERQLNIEILQHFQEIESRKLYLERGFSSLFDYAVRELGYSRGSAFRRIKAMKLCKDIPETKSQLESGKLNLSSASQLQNFFEKQARKPLKKDFKKNHFSQQTSIETLQQQQSKKIQTSLAPSGKTHFCKNRVCDSSTQKCCSETLIKENLPNKEKTHKFNTLSKLRSDSFCAELNCSAEPKGLSLTKKKELLEKAQGQSTRDIEKMLVETDSACVSSHKEKARFIGDQKIELKVILDEDCFKNLENLKNLLSHKNPRMSYRELISLLAELGLKKYDPRRKLNQKQKLARKQENQKVLCSKEECNNTNLNLFNKEGDQSLSNLSTNDIKSKRDIENQGEGKSVIQNKSPSNLFKNLNKPKIKNTKTLNEYIIQNKPQKTNRSIPQKIRRYIWKRDQGECSYVCPKTKNKCRSKHLLQIDHIQPFALGGSHHPDNLRLLCAKHNHYRSQRTFGFKS